MQLELKRISVFENKNLELPSGSGDSIFMAESNIFIVILEQVLVSWTRVALEFFFIQILAVILPSSQGILYRNKCNKDAQRISYSWPCSQAKNPRDPEIPYQRLFWRWTLDLPLVPLENSSLLSGAISKTGLCLSEMLSGGCSILLGGCPRKLCGFQQDCGSNANKIFLSLSFHSLFGKSRGPLSVFFHGALPRPGLERGG